MGSIVAELADKIAADSGLSQVKSIEIEQSSTGGVAGALKVDNDDVDKQAIVVEAANTTADVFDITADAVTTAKVIDITADGLTTGSALYIDDNSADTGTRSDVTIIQNHDSAIAATALTVQSDAGVTGMLLDKNFPAAAVAAATVRGLWVDFDHTVPGSGTAAQHDIGIDLDVNSATLGTSTSTGLDIDVVGATTGTHTVVGLDVTVSAADVNYAAKFAGGGIMIKEQAAADTDIAAYGQIWVDDAANSPLMYTNDAGADIGITTGSTLNAASLGGVMPVGVTGGSGLTDHGLIGASCRIYLTSAVTGLSGEQYLSARAWTLHYNDDANLYTPQLSASDSGIQILVAGTYLFNWSIYNDGLNTDATYLQQFLAYVEGTNTTIPESYVIQGSANFGSGSDWFKPSNSAIVEISANQIISSYFNVQSGTVAVNAGLNATWITACYLHN